MSNEHLLSAKQAAEWAAQDMYPMQEMEPGMLHGEFNAQQIKRRTIAANYGLRAIANAEVHVYEFTRSGLTPDEQEQLRKLQERDEQ